MKSVKKTVIALNGKMIGTHDQYHKIINNNDQEYRYIAADRGAIILEKINILPDIIIGDLDSLPPKKIKYYRDKNIEIKKHPVEKDKTDGELAVDYCKNNDYNTIMMIGAFGGRYDQQLANIFLLEYALTLGLDMIIKEPGIEIGLIKNSKKFINKKGKRLSLLPLSQQVTGVNIRGCKYNIVQEKLFRYQTRGISNIIKKDKCVISLEKGLLLYFISKNINSSS